MAVGLGLVFLGAWSWLIRRGGEVEETIMALDSSEPEVRRDLLEDLGAGGPVHKSVMGAIVKACSDGDPRVRKAAVHAVARLDASRGEFLDAVMSGSRDSDPAVRMWAAVGLGEYHVRRKEGVQALVILLRRDRDERVRSSAARALGGFGECAENAVGDLLEVAREGDPGLRIACAIAIGKIAPGRLPKDMEADAIEALPMEGALQAPGR